MGWVVTSCLARIAQSEQPMPREAPRQARAERAHPIGVGSDEPLILVVDDDATARDLVEQHVQRAGFAAVTARGGQEALRLVRELQPTAGTPEDMIADLAPPTVNAATDGAQAVASTPV